MADRIEPPPYFWFWVPDFMGGVLAGTAPLDNDEIAIYVLILCLQWQAGGPIDDDSRRIGTACRRDRRMIERILDALVSKRKLIREGGKIYNKRMQKEIERHAKRELARQARATLKQGGTQQRLPLIGALPGGRAKGPERVDQGVAAALDRLGKTFANKR